ncbi:MAG: hypothetical protein CUN52_06000 [Phototrophicales bacterium]|nr:MAG: hypothetical protein CUN52_06000 [Phototrophicales bacterium]
MVKHAVILAVGSLSHRSQLTYNRAHAMLPALGKPLVIRIMDRLYRVGIRHYTVVVGENEGAVVNYLNTQWMPDVTVNYTLKFPNDSFVKTIKTIAQKINEPFIVCSYNSFTHTHFPDALLNHYEKNTDVLLFSGASSTLSQAPQQVFAITESDIVKEIVTASTPERRALTLIDFFVCGAPILDYILKLNDKVTYQESHRQFMDIARRYIESGGKGMMVRANWVLQVEADHDLLTLNRHLLDEGQDAHILSELPYTVKIIPPVRIDPQVNVGQGAKIGPHVYLERGASVGHDVILKDCIVLNKANVPSQKSLTSTILTTRGPLPT